MDCDLDLALFDFDGTVTTRKNLPAFVPSATPGWRVALAAPPLAPPILAAAARPARWLPEWHRGRHRSGG
jgi:hypothetical protein